MYCYKYITVKINGPLCPSELMSGREKKKGFFFFFPVLLFLNNQKII